MSRFWHIVAFWGLITLSTAVVTAGETGTDSPRESADNRATAQARAIRADNIHSVYLVAEKCGPEVGKALQNRHLRLGKPGETVDVILELRLTPISGWLTEAPLIGRFLGGFATRASYEARLIGRDEHVLLSLHGEERAITGREMCQDIGDDLADRLTRRRDGD